MAGSRMVGSRLDLTLSLCIATLLLVPLIAVESARARHGRGTRRGRQEGLLPEYTLRQECGIGPPFGVQYRSNGTLDCDGNGPVKSHRIAGGSPLEPGQFPSYVSIKVTSGNGVPEKCSGVLIDDDIALTAAHCFMERPIYGVEVSPSNSPSDYWLDDNAPVYEVSRVCQSPSFNDPTHAHDYAIIKLRQRIPMTSDVRPACLPNEEVATGTEARTVGQGLTSMPIWDDPETWSWARTVKVLAVEKVNCPRKFANEQTIVCYQSPENEMGGDTCPGDSGGPIYVMQGGVQTVAALTLFGDRVCAPGVNGISKNADLSRRLNRNFILHLTKRCIEEGWGQVFQNQQEDD